jgi:hypothetical protein
MAAATTMQDAIAHGLAKDVARGAVAGLMIGTEHILEKRRGCDRRCLRELSRSHRYGNRGDVAGGLQELLSTDHPPPKKSRSGDA